MDQTPHTPKVDARQDGAPQDGTSDNDGPEAGVSRDGAPKDGTPQDGAHENDGSEADPVDLEYAGFKPRAIAHVIDFVVLLPLALLNVILFHQSRFMAAIAAILTFLITCLYYLILHAKYGRTLGKFVAGIALRKLDGSPIDFRQAAMRESVFIILKFLVLCCGLYILATWEGAWEMKASRHTILYDYRNKLAPWFGYLMQIWIWSELLTLFLNPKRQSFQDRIASTVVVHVPEPAEESQDDAQQVEYEQGPQLIQKPESDVKDLSLPDF